MSYLFSLSIFPLDKGESVSEYVARVVKLIKEAQVSYKVTPMETIFECNSLEEGLELLKKAFSVLEVDCNRIICNIKIDYRRGRERGLVTKIKSLEERLGEKLE